MGHQTFQFLKRNVCQVGRGDEFFLPPAPRSNRQVAFPYFTTLRIFLTLFGLIN